MGITTNELGNTVVTDPIDGSFYIIAVAPNDTARIFHYEDAQDAGNMFSILFPSHDAALAMLAPA